MMYLPVLVDIEPDELDFSVASRLCDANGLRRLGDIAGVEKNCTRHAAPFEALGKIIKDMVAQSGGDAAIADAISFKERGKNLVQHQKYGDLPIRAIERNYARICPVCFEEKQYLKVQWCLRPVLACEKHHVLLVQECPECSRSIKLSLANFRYCSCGYDFRRLKKVRASLPARMSAYVFASDHTQAEIVGALCNLPTDIVGLNAKDSSNLVEFLSSHLVQPNYGIEGSVYNVDPSLRNKLLAETYELLVDYPNNLFDALDCRYDPASAKTNQRRNILGRFYLSISDRRSKLSVLKNDVDAYIRDRIPELAETRKGRFRSSLTANFDRVSLADAISYSGYSKQKLRSFVKAGQLDDRPIVNGKSVIHRLRAKDLCRIMTGYDDLDRLELIKELEDQVGFSAPVVRKLIKAGLLRSDLPADASVRWLERNIRPAAQKSDHKPVTLRCAIMGHFRRKGMSAADVMNHLMKNRDVVIEVREGAMPFADRVMLASAVVVGD